MSLDNYGLLSDMAACVWGLTVGLLIVFLLSPTNRRDDD